MENPIKEQFVHFRDPYNPDGDPPASPTSRVEVMHDTCYFGSLEILAPSIKRRIQSGKVVGRFLKDDENMSLVFADNGVPLVDVLAMVEIYCKPVVEEGEQVSVFSPEDWPSEDLLVQVYEKVKEYHATFR